VKRRLKTGAKVRVEIDEARRRDIARNHTATHILHHELRSLLGGHVEQAGSLVEPDRLRLDFTHGQALAREETDEVERRVNERILADAPVGAEETTVEEAKRKGAMALFGEKYGERVRMVSVGDFSKELCGGTHLDRTGEIGLFRIVSEESVAAGVRRITAVTGRGAYRSVKELEGIVSDLSRSLKVPPGELAKHVLRDAERIRELERELRAAKKRAITGGGVEALLSGAKEVEGVAVVAANLGEARADDLRSAADVLRPRLSKESPGGAVLCLAGAAGGKVSIACWVMPKALVKRGVSAGAIVKAIAPVVGGGGGGRDEMAQAGGKDASKMDEALAKVEGLVREALAGN
jgi:alanyl-tRNA synthetase